MLGAISGRPPALDLERERALLDLLLEAASADLLASAHDCGDGGLGGDARRVGRRAGTGSRSPCRATSRRTSRCSPSRPRAPSWRWRPSASSSWRTCAAARGVPFATVGETGGPRVVFDGLFETTVHELRDVYEGAIPRLLGEDV